MYDLRRSVNVQLPVRYTDIRRDETVLDNSHGVPDALRLVLGSAEEAQLVYHRGVGEALSSLINTAVEALCVVYLRTYLRQNFMDFFHVLPVGKRQVDIYHCRGRHFCNFADIAVAYRGDVVVINIPQCGGLYGEAYDLPSISWYFTTSPTEKKWSLMICIPMKISLSTS